VKIWFQKHTVQGRLPILDEMYEKHFQSILRSDDLIHVESLPANTYDKQLPEGLVRFAGAESIFLTHFMKMAAKAERDGFDAYIVGTSQDPGLRECRALVDIPVIGYGECAAIYSLISGFKVGVAGFIPELFEAIEENYIRMGLSKMLVGSSALTGGPDIMVEAFKGNPIRHREAFFASARDLIKQGATVIVPGEGLSNELLVSQGIKEVDGVPVLDPVALTLEFARLMHSLKELGVPSKSQFGYWSKSLDKEARDRLLSIFLSK
jgi:allantoin racemase